MSREPLPSPLLQILGEPAAGRLFALTKDLTIIGRGLDCDLILDPRTVSRRHAAITRRGGEFLIRDLESTRGTFLDGRRVIRPTPLWDDARIQLGEVSLRFLTRAAEILTSSVDESTVFTSIADPLVACTLPEAHLQAEEVLLALRKLGREFGGDLDLRTLLAHVLDSLFDVFPQASFGFVLLEGADHELVTEAMKSRSDREDDSAVDASALDRVTREGLAVLGRDARGDRLAEGRAGSLIRAPVLDAERRPVGLVQLHADEKRGLFSEEDLDLLASIAGQISVALQNVRMHRDLIHHREFESELQSARRVMRALLPERPSSVEGYEFWNCYEPARQVGGDYYGFIPILGPDDDPGRPALCWALAVGDVVGKGLPAALLTARLSAEVSHFLQDARDPADVVTRLNRRLFDHGVLDMFITFLLVILDVETHTLKIVNAGHPAPLVRRRDGSIEEIGRETAGFPLAIDGSTEYETYVARLEPGEIVVLYTDGVTDAMSATGDRFSDARLREVLARPHASPRDAAEATLRAIRSHAAACPQFDDITLVAFGRLAPAAPTWEL